MGDIIGKMFVDPDPPFPMQEDFYGWVQVLFHGGVYAYVLFHASNMISEGSELLLLTPAKGLVGSVVLPVLGAVPDGAIILFSGATQQQLAVGVGALAGSTVMLLTIPWCLAIIAGRVDLRDGRPRYQAPKLTSAGLLGGLTSTGSAVDESIGSAGVLMLVTASTYVLIQVPAIVLQGCGVADCGCAELALVDQKACIANATEQGLNWALAGLILAVLLFFGYLFKQWRNLQDAEEGGEKSELQQRILRKRYDVMMRAMRSSSIAGGGMLRHIAGVDAQTLDAPRNQLFARPGTYPEMFEFCIQRIFGEFNVSKSTEQIKTAVPYHAQTVRGGRPPSGGSFGSPPAPGSQSAAQPKPRSLFPSLDSPQSPGVSSPGSRGVASPQSAPGSQGPRSKVPAPGKGQSFKQLSQTGPLVRSGSSDVARRRPNPALRSQAAKKKRNAPQIIDADEIGALTTELHWPASLKAQLKQQAFGRGLTLGRMEDIIWDWAHRPPAAIDSAAATPPGSARNLNPEDGDDEDGDSADDMPDEWKDLSPAEQQLAIWKRALMLMGVGTVTVLVFSDPMCDILGSLGERLGISAFYVSFILAPLASNAAELISAYTYALKKTQQTMTISLSSLLGAACMNNTFCLAIFLYQIHSHKLRWEFTAETISILAVEILMFFFAVQKVQRTWYAFVVLSVFPLSICLVYALEHFGLD